MKRLSLNFFNGMIALLSLGALATHSQTATDADIAITHAKIFTLAGAPIDDGTVVIHEGKIAVVGAGVAIPVGAQVIDAKGLQVYPGLFDPVTQMGLSEISAVIATVDTTETGPFNPDVTAATAILPSSAHIPVTRASGITEVIAAPASGGFDSRNATNLVGGQASAVHLAGWTAEEMLINKQAAMVVDWPDFETRSFDFSTFSIKEKPFADAKKEYDKQVNELVDYVEQARHYEQALKSSPGVGFQRDVKLEAMAPVVRGEMPLLVFADKARQIRDAVEFCDKQKLKIILAGGKEAWKEKDLLRSKSVPVILRPTLAEPSEEDDAYDRLLTQPEELRAAGIKIAFGSFDNSFARRLGQNAANAVAHGLPYDEGLKAVTLYPAQMFGLDSKLGTIEKGKLANLIVTNGDPLEVTTDVRYLFINGQLTSTDNKQKALYEKYLNRPKAAR
ncbi:MAG TPA: amidohydrolase family protein [Candidatus Limnocylindrales bacterium]|nr:amidohydrolase family protein [Candidatus Limnocylindrales bacterium]